MNSVSGAVLDWVESQSEHAESTLSSRYLGEELSILNADQVVELINALWHDFCGGGSGENGGVSDLDAADRFGVWEYVRGGMGQLELAMDGSHHRVARDLGQWPLAGDKTVALLEGLCEAAPAERRR